MNEPPNQTLDMSNMSDEQLAHLQEMAAVRRNELALVQAQTEPRMYENAPIPTPPLHETLAPPVNESAPFAAWGIDQSPDGTQLHIFNAGKHVVSIGDPAGGFPGRISKVIGNPADQAGEKWIYLRGATDAYHNMSAPAYWSQTPGD